MITNIGLAKTLNEERARLLATRQQLAETEGSDMHSIRHQIGRRLENLGRRLQGPDLPHPSRSSV